MNNGQQQKRFQPRIVTVTPEGGHPEKVYEVASGRYQTKEQLSERLAKLDGIEATARAAKDEPDMDALLATHQRRQDRRIEMAGRVKAALESAIAEL